MKRGRCLFISILFFILCSSTWNIVGKLEESKFYILDPPEGFIGKKMFYDSVYLHVNLMSVDTLKMLAIFTPWYLAARSADRPLSECFYCSDERKNLCTMSRSCHTVADKSTIAITAGLSLMSIFPQFDEDIRLTARVFTVGLVPVWGLKNAFKRIRHEGCLRPKCEFFDKNKKYYGGCPSGHMAFMSYGLTLFGLQFGYKFGIPLGIASLGVFAASIDGNRHYASQLIAGTGLGAIYGIAAHKVVNEYLDTNLHCDIVAGHDGSPALQISHSF